MSDAPAGDPIGFEVDGDIADAAEMQTDVVDETAVDDAPSRQYVEFDDPDNRYARVKVAGEDVEVPYSELVKGYSREADYTRKTQELAQQRQEAEYGIRLQQALQANPQATLRLLAEQAGLPLGEQQQQARQVEEDQYTDPLEREIAQERQARQALEQRLAQRDMDEHVERTISSLRTQYNASDEDIRDVVAVAMQHNYPVEALPMIYKSMTLDKLQARFQAQQAAKATQEAETVRRTAAKANASTAVSARSAQGNGLTDRAQLQERPSIRDAALAAFDELERRH